MAVVLTLGFDPQIFVFLSKRALIWSNIVRLNLPHHFPIWKKKEKEKAEIKETQSDVVAHFCNPSTRHPGEDNGVSPRTAQ